MNHTPHTLASVCTAVFTLLLGAFSSPAQTSTNPPQNWPAPQEGDYTVHDFHFQSGETLPEVRLHYYTLGKPLKDATGRTTNAVLLSTAPAGEATISFSPSSPECSSVPASCSTPTNIF